MPTAGRRRRVTPSGIRRCGDGRGTEHLTSADTRDQDYDELLERVCEKGLPSPTGLATMWYP